MNKKKVVYAKAPKNIARALEESEVIEDFLPPPEKLIFKVPKVKVTMSMNTNTVNIFKAYAQKHNLSYQTMINEVVDKYAKKYQKTLTAR
jgi:predicted DNA binding CopG/RHH family protein